MPTQVCVHIGAQKLPSPIVCCLPGWTLMALHLEGAQGAAVCPALTAAWTEWSEWSIIVLKSEWFGVPTAAVWMQGHVV